MKRAAILLLLLTGCQTTTETARTETQPNYREIILANKSNLFKDPDSIKDAYIGTARPSMMGWNVCLRANAKNSYGGYAGQQTVDIQIYRNGSPPVSLPLTIYDNCGQLTPFPEIEGGYIPPQRQSRKH